jgi:hypothetical protein
MSTIRCDVKQVYYLLGNLSLDQLPLEVALPVFYNTIIKYLNLYRVSPNNFFLKYVERPITGELTNLEISDYGTLVQIQAHSQNSADGPGWVPVRHVAFEQLGSFEKAGTLAASIYNQDSHQVIKFSRQNYDLIPRQVRIWYEPALPIEDHYQSDNLIPECFKPLVEYEAASILGKMVRNVDPDTKAGIVATAMEYKAQAYDFRVQFEELVNRSPEVKPYKRNRPRLRTRFTR